MQGSKEQAGQKSTVLRVDQEQQEFVFMDVASKPVPSLLRDFSAPVKMEVKGQTDADLIFLLAHDTGTPAAPSASLCSDVSSVTCLLGVVWLSYRSNVAYLHVTSSQLTQPPMQSLHM